MEEDKKKGKIQNKQFVRPNTFEIVSPYNSASLSLFFVPLQTGLSEIMPRLTDFIFYCPVKNGARELVLRFHADPLLSRESVNRVSIMGVDRCIRLELPLSEYTLTLFECSDRTF